MDIIIDWQSYETDFDGEKVSMEIRPLKSYAMFALMPYLDNPNPRNKDEDPKDYAKRLTVEEKNQLTLNSQKIQELSIKIFPDHVRNIEGITVNGQPITFEHISEESLFMSLAVDIAGQLASITTLKKEDEKNSERESDLIVLEKVTTSQ